MNILIDESHFLSWQGGRNYLKNILIALKESGATLHRLKRENSLKEIDYLFDYTHVEVYPKRFSLNRIGLKLSRKKTWRKLNPWINTVDVSFQVANNDIQQFVKSVRWIPDFQHIEMPEQFSAEEIEKRNAEFGNFAHHYDIILLSSYHAQRIFNRLYPFATEKSRVYQFQVTIPEAVYELKEQEIREKYNLPEKYIHFPAQWWTHKNHKFIFEVMAQTEKNVCLVCTGNETDYRNPSYSTELKSFIHQNKLDSKIRLLGDIPYIDMLAIMRFSHCVINPSSYEGWSTTVEEAKLLGKRILCLETELFREQISKYKLGSLVKLNSDDWVNSIEMVTNSSLEQCEGINQKRVEILELFG